MDQKNKILIIGGSRYIGKYIVNANAKAGHMTFALIRESTFSNPDQSEDEVLNIALVCHLAEHVEEGESLSNKMEEKLQQSRMWRLLGFDSRKVIAYNSACCVHA